MSGYIFIIREEARRQRGLFISFLSDMPVLVTFCKLADECKLLLPLFSSATLGKNRILHLSTVQCPRWNASPVTWRHSTQVPVTCVITGPLQRTTSLHPCWDLDLFHFGSGNGDKSYPTVTNSVQNISSNPKCLLKSNSFICNPQIVMHICKSAQLRLIPLHTDLVFFGKIPRRLLKELINLNWFSHRCNVHMHPNVVSSSKPTLFFTDYST